MKATDPRQFAEHHPVGTRLVWPSTPIVRSGGQRIAAPSNVGVVSWHTSGRAFVRFRVDSINTEPLEVVGGQICKEQQQ